MIKHIHTGKVYYMIQCPPIFKNIKLPSKTILLIICPRCNNHYLIYSLKSNKITYDGWAYLSCTGHCCYELKYIKHINYRQYI